MTARRLLPPLLLLLLLAAAAGDSQGRRSAAPAEPTAAASTAPRITAPLAIRPLRRAAGTRRAVQLRPAVFAADTDGPVPSTPAAPVPLVAGTDVTLVRPVALPHDTVDTVPPARRSAGRPLSTALDAHLTPAAPPRATRRGDPDPIILELLLGRIASRTVEGYRIGQRALIPLSAFLEMAELRGTRRPDGSLEAVVQPGNVPLVLDPASRTLRVGKTRRVLAADELVVGAQDLFVSTDVLVGAFGLEFDVSWPDLQVVVVEPSALPVARRLRRETMMRARLSHASEAAYTGLRLGVPRAGVDGLVLDYSVLTPTNSLDGTSYATNLGLDVLGGSLALGLQSQGSASRSPRVDASWTGIWRENPWLSQLRLGDGFATGPRGRNLRGFSMGNSPYVRPATLGSLPFSGMLGQGWTVEAYRGGRLIGFDSVNALGQFSFDVPIQYGENPVDFVAYGPFGEVREFNQTYRALTDGLPARRLEYGISAGQCRTRLCTASGNVDVRYGLTTRWTLRAGVDQFWRDSAGGLTHGYVGALGALTNAILVEGEAVQDAVVRGAVRFEPSVNLQVGVEANRFAQGVKAPILTPAGRRNQVTVNAFFRPWGARGSTYFDASLDRIHADGGDLTSARLGGSVQVAGVRVVPAVRLQQQHGAGPVQHQTFLGVNAFILPQPSLGPALGGVTARASLEYEKGVGAAAASAYLSRTLTRGLRAEVGTSWYRGLRGPEFSLLFAAELPSVRSYTTMTAGGGQEARGIQYVTGSAIYNPARGGVDFSGSPGLARGGVTGRVFLDLNGNGHFDRGEEPLEGVRVVVGPVFAMSDAHGTYRVWDLLPYEPTAVTVDSLSLGSPLWVPAFAMASIEPSPNRYRTLDVPVLPGGVLEGRVTTASGLPAAGATLVLTHPQSGEQRLVRTFSDGTYYLLGVRPGEWQLSVDAKCLEIYRATAPVLRFTVAGNRDGATLSGLDIQLR